MTFEENPFRVLNVSIHDTKATIIERADDLSFADPDREEIIERARDILLNPRKRIAAEFWEIAAQDFDTYSLKNARTLDEFDIATIDRKFSALNAESIREQINAARTKSKFPAVQDTAAIRDELKNLRNEIRGRIQDTLKAMNHSERYLLANDFANAIARANSKFGVTVEDFFDSYRLEINPLLDETTGKIFDLLTQLKATAAAKLMVELAVNINNFVGAQRPLDAFSMALGTNNFDETEKIFHAVRSTAIELHNEKNLLDEPLRIIRLLEKNFSYLPQLAELIRNDIMFLEKSKASQPTQAFLGAKVILDTIQAAMDRELHLAKGFEEANLDFYLKTFNKIYEPNLQGLMIQRKYKPDEWQYLNAKVAVIYLHMGTAMTWTHFHPKTTLELFCKALPYAEQSGDTELISLVRKRVAEWQNINQRIYNDSSSSGCLSVVAVAAVIFLLLL